MTHCIAVSLSVFQTFQHMTHLTAFKIVIPPGVPGVYWFFSARIKIIGFHFTLWCNPPYIKVNDFRQQKYDALNVNWYGTDCRRVLWCDPGDLTVYVLDYFKESLHDEMSRIIEILPNERQGPKDPTHCHGCQWAGDERIGEWETSAIF